jgi:general secretion pathway protein D
MFRIERALAEDVVRVIQALLRPTGPGGPGGVPGQPGAPVVSAPGGTMATPQIIADPRTNLIIIQAYPYQFPQIEELIKALDVPTPLKPPHFFVYKCRNIDAAYLAGKLSELFTGAKGGAGAGRKSSGGGGAKPGQPGPGGAAPGGMGAINLNPQAGGQGGQQKADFSAIETRVVPDELSNSLLIQAEKPIFDQILKLLQGDGTPENPGLDRPRRRVLIEAQVWEISTPTDNLTIGFELAGVQNPKQGAFRPSALTDFGLSTVTPDPATGVITRTPNLSQGLVAVLTKDTFSKLPLIVEAVANLEHSRIVTTPFALTNDNEEADFTITQNIPFQTSTLAGTGLAQTNVSNLQVQTKLTVQPQVNSDENLTLTVTVDLGSIGAQGGAGLPPQTNQRTYNGTVTVPNMRYVVFGGLESESYGEVETKVPWLGDIPILGHLFKQKQWTHQNAKIYVFIRPTIFSDDRPIVRVSDDLRQKAHVEAERDEWLPPIASEQQVKAPWKTIQDQVFDVFGTGSGNPFSAQPKDE